jgi:hypothetical protein
MTTEQSKKALAIRTCNKDMTAYGGFKWAESGQVSAPDWSANAVCGQGLHALLDGFGNYSHLSNDIDAKWLVVEVDRASCVDLGGKVKFPSCEVVYCGNMADAMTRISNHQVKLLIEAAKPILAECRPDSETAASGNYSTLAASGNYSTLAASGYNSTLAASGNYSKLAASGNYSTLAASGYNSTLAASGESSTLAASGNYSKLAASGNYSKLAASGNYSTLAASGYNSTLAASGNYSKLAASGNYSTLAASGYNSTLAASGNYSTLAASGNYSTLAASGYNSTLAASGESSIAMCAGLGSVVKAGKNGCIAATWRDSANRIRVAVGYIGEDGIKEDTFYAVDKTGKFVEMAG